MLFKNFLKKCIAFCVECDTIQSNETNTHCCCAIANTLNKCIKKMKINYEMLKKFDDIEIYRNVDEFYKMHYNCMIDDTFNDVNDLFQLSCDMQHMYSSYEHFQNQIKLNNIENYIIICDFEHEKIYLCENMINDVKMYYVDNECVFYDDFKIQRFENENEKNRIIKTLFINLIYDIL